MMSPRDWAWASMWAVDPRNVTVDAGWFTVRGPSRGWVLGWLWHNGHVT